MNWLQKSLLTVAAITSFNHAIAQTYNYDILLGCFNINMGKLQYNKENKTFSASIDKFYKIDYSFQLLNDSTLVEENKTKKFHERYVYHKDSSGWCLDELITLSGIVREDKKKLVGASFEKDYLSTIETLEKVFNSEIKDTTNVVLFGCQYNIKINNDYIDEKNRKIKTNIEEKTFDEVSKGFLLKDDLIIQGNYNTCNFTPNYIQAEFDLKIMNAKVKIKLKE